MLLIHTQKPSPRIDYAFKHICTRILGLKVEFTSVIESFIAHQGPKLSYGKQPMGNELFVQAFGLLNQEGLEDVEISTAPWDGTIGFFPAGEKSALPFDIFAAAFYLLSRYEEYMPHVKDSMGRFPASHSLAAREAFLTQPVVDIWAYRFRDLLLERFPDITFAPRHFQEQHLVSAAIPYAYANRGFLRNFSGFFRDLGRFRLKEVVRRSQVLLKLKKDPYDTFEWLIESLKSNAAKLFVFFRMGEGYTFGEDMNSKRENFRLLVKHIADYTEVGLLFSYHSLGNEERMKQERKTLEDLIHKELLYTMNDQGVVNLPHYYRNLLEVEIPRDMTMVYADRLGFRAGTCTPFLFYDLDYEIKTPLVIHPIAGCTRSLHNLSPGEMDHEVAGLREAVKAVDGTFSMRCSNQDFKDNNRHRRQLFSIPRYETRTDQ
ncbi:MAG: hypothetical protein AAF466_07810 [Bacteroidota bacterium]